MNEQKKYVFTWHVTDGYTYGYDVHIPFQTADLEKFVFEQLEKLKNSEHGYIEVFGVGVYENEAEFLERSILPLEEWFLSRSVEVS